MIKANMLELDIFLPKIPLSRNPFYPNSFLPKFVA